MARDDSICHRRATIADAEPLALSVITQNSLRPRAEHGPAGLALCGAELHEVTEEARRGHGHGTSLREEGR